jgi:hypothetical protein
MVTVSVSPETKKVHFLGKIVSIGNTNLGVLSADNVLFPPIDDHFGVGEDIGGK